ncbi:MAG: peptidoglycan editing factor PgeF [Kangiellaceae bacterium]|nr:peptidoglycan editing factor PgeF [Kangiellaceae bacterium]
MQKASPSLIIPNWPAPNIIRAFSSTRIGGVSQACYQGLNLAQHVNDEVVCVEQNRQQLQQLTQYPPALWLEQVHSNIAIEYDLKALNSQVDASFTQHSQQTCVVMTADCLPVLFCNQAGDWIAAAHAGWRGLADGVLLNTLKNYSGTSSLMAWIGPAISQKYFEVGDDVKQVFIEQDSDNSQFFVEKANGKWLCDLAGIAKQQLQNNGVEVYLSNLCSFSDSEHFYSYRRDGRTGRMASLIWIDTNAPNGASND